MNQTSVHVDVEINADTYCQDRDSAPIRPIGHDQGFYMEGSTYRFSVLCREYPLVSDGTTYWFGAYRVFHHYIGRKSMHHHLRVVGVVGRGRIFKLDQVNMRM
jgi:hypothetical protein